MKNGALLSDSDWASVEPQSFFFFSPESVKLFVCRIKNTWIVMEHWEKHRRHPEGRSLQLQMGVEDQDQESGSDEMEYGDE